MEENKKVKVDIDNNENISSNTVVDNAENVAGNISKGGQVKKSRIIPSYEKKSENIETKKEKKYNSRRKSKISLIIIIFIIIVLLLAVLYGIYSLINYSQNKKYQEYEKTMDVWGFSRMYNNKKASFYENVSKSEAVKIIVSSTLNSYDISNYYSIQNPSYDNEAWVKYAESFDLISEDEINSKNENQNISIVEFLNILSKVKTKILNLSLDIEEITKYNFVERSNNDDQAILKDMIYNKILVDIDDNTNINKKLSKGLCNQLIYNFVKKYSLITIEGEKLNINEEKLPLNSEEYPYILANIKKDIYEKRFFYEDVGKSKKPIEIYADMKDKYKSMKYIVNDYLDLIFNVNYENINKDKYINVLSEVSGNTKSSINMIKSDSIQKYIDFVKTNNIKIEGSYKIQDPIIYFDGIYYRVRVSVSYNVISNNLSNLLYMDENSNIVTQYKIGQTQEYYDLKLKIINNVLYVVPEALYSQKVS